MDEKEKLRLKKQYEEMPEEELIQRLSVEEIDYKEGIYELLLQAVKRRGLLRVDLGKPIPMRGAMDSEKQGAYASSNKRFLNLLLDYLISYGMAVIVGFVLGFILVFVGIVDRSYFESLGENKFADYSIGIIFTFIYYFIFESIFQRTPAKYITKTKVLDLRGSRPTKSQILKRTLIRFIPFEAFSGFGEKEWYGWHDRWSYTMVVASNYPESVSETDSSKVSTRTAREIKICPYCAEEIPTDKQKCPFCEERIIDIPPKRENP